MSKKFYITIGTAIYVFLVLFLIMHFKINNLVAFNLGVWSAILA